MAPVDRFPGMLPISSYTLSLAHLRGRELRRVRLLTSSEDLPEPASHVVNYLFPSMCKEPILISLGRSPALNMQKRETGLYHIEQNFLAHVSNRAIFMGSIERRKKLFGNRSRRLSDATFLCD